MMNWRVALRLGRVSNLPTVWSNVAAGAALSGRLPAAQTLLSLLLAMSLIYCAGMFLNDAFDHEIDALERPERPIPSGQASRREVLAFGFAMLAGGVALLSSLGLPALLASLLLAACVVFYDLRHKQNHFSPLLMGLCRALVYFTSALAATGGQLPAPVWLGAMLLLAYLMGLTYAAKQEGAGRITRAWPLLGLAAPALYLLTQPASWQAWLCLGLFSAWVSRCAWLSLFRAKPDIRAAVGGLIAGISLYDAFLMAMHGLPLWALGGGAAFLLTCGFQKRIAGT
ncbi:UbiA family prenyltransferase [Chromobacterium sp. IIBBL 290-4]|uniref:UbiA family prenyltransferase n=1 Tax=Chromobacterium sp. IIBBL 290-4 TaxID=2953890 RepID=UPI0020B6ABAD|nr:UbiA family prenyltransferase [Chromobacterium sp. IIBBL 290-4]UTH74060.1 UbiA family prenyltransferase [Chromobacterium sp. IIBBL 290-4]